MKKNIVLLFSLMCGAIGFSQNDFTVFFEPEISIDYTVTERYSHSFSIENRNYISKNNRFNFEAKQLEIAHFSNIEYKSGHQFGLGIQYRFEKTFTKTEENEFRLMQQYSWMHKNSNLKLKNRVRNEQRIYHSETKYRLRYELGFTFYLNETSSYFKAETETLIAWSKLKKPEFEERISSVFGWQFQYYNLEVGVQYRLSDFTQQLGHELFFVTGLNVSL